MRNATKPGDEKQQSVSKKLVVKRETLAVIDPAKLDQVVGGRKLYCRRSV